jgi:hypothetical protein
MKTIWEYPMGRGEFLRYGLAAAGWFLLGSAAVPGGSESGQRAEKAGAPGAPRSVKVYSVEKRGYVVEDRVVRSEAEWKKILTPEQYQVTRKKGTERPFTGKYWNEHGAGVYRCVCCGNDLFSSDTKFESGTGWPSFYAPVAPENVRNEEFLHETDRSPVQPVRRPPRTRVPRRAEAHGTAVLHELRVAGFRSGGPAVRRPGQGKETVRGVRPGERRR